MDRSQMNYFYVCYQFGAGGSFDVVCDTMLEAYSIAKHLRPNKEPVQICRHDSPITSTLYFTEKGYADFKANVVSQPVMMTVLKVAQ